MFKTVSLPAETWAKIVRRLTSEVGADDASRIWAGAIQEQASGTVKVRAVSSRASPTRGWLGDRGTAGPFGPHD